MSAAPGTDFCGAGTRAQMNPDGTCSEGSQVLLSGELVCIPDGMQTGLEELQIIVDLMRMASLVLGFTLFALGMYGFHKYVKSGGQHTVAQCISTLLAGACLISVPIIMETTQSTLIPVGSSPYAVSNAFDAVALKRRSACVFADGVSSLAEGGEGFAKFMPKHTGDALWTILYILGIYAYIKGIFLLRHIGSQRGSQEGLVGSAFTHILGGFALINITTVGCWLASAAGFGAACD